MSFNLDSQGQIEEHGRVALYLNTDINRGFIPQMDRELQLSKTINSSISYHLAIATNDLSKRWTYDAYVDYKIEGDSKGLRLKSSNRIWIFQGGIDIE
mmetsp:Transcript_14672/g.14472  ORF Transcript_14672/g.14472 Transcript_14672/m.14472 type:complete len:98 (-) Transcript_14672:193-486(-)